MNKLWAFDTERYGALANMLLGTATYDATIAAWDTKYAYKRSRPFDSDKRIRSYTVRPASIAAAVLFWIIYHHFITKALFN